MTPLRKLSNKKLDELQDRLTRRLGESHCQARRQREVLNKKLWKVMNERLRRIGL